MQSFLKVFRGVSLAGMLLVVGCGSRLENSLAGGAAGAGLGAGIGAAVGSIITNGDVPGSAIMGASIGIPVGLVLGLALSAYDDEVQEKDRSEEYRKNQLVIMERERQIEGLREEVRQETPTGNPDRNLKQRIHMGPTLGSYYR